MKATEIGLKNPYLVIVVVLAVVVVGVTSLMRLPTDLLPEFKTPAVQILTFYPGMPPEVMERDIMSRLERWTGQSIGIEHQEAKAMMGVCIVKDFFREGISSDTAMSQVTSYAMSDLFYLPPGTIPPMVMPFDPTASVPLCLVSVSSPTLSEQKLYDIAYYELRNRLQSIKGVIAPAVYGGVLRRILAYVDPMELQARDLSPMDVVKTIQKQSVFIPTGNAKFGDIDYQIISNAMPEKVDLLNDLPVKTTEDGTVVFMRDIGQVKDSHQIQGNIVRINGRRQVYIPIYRQPGANTIAIVDAIKTQLEQILKRLKDMNPEAKSVSLEVVMDQSVFVRTSINSLSTEAGLGALLAGLVVLIFLRSLRATIIAVVALPFSILAAFIGMFYTGDSINSMTLGGIALAVGIILDQAIVVLENISRHLEMGKSRYQAALDGAREVALPVLVAVVTFCVVFFPVVFLSGISRFLFQPLAVAVIFAILASYVVALFVIPTFCMKFLKHKAQATQDTSSSGSWISRLFDHLLPPLLSARYLVVGLAALAFVAAGYLLLNIGRELFPPVDSNQFTIYVRLPSGTRIEKTEEAMAEIEKVLLAKIGEPDPEYPRNEKYNDSNMRILISNAGVLMDWPAAYTPNTGPMDAFILVQLKGKKGLPTTFEYVEELRTELNQKFPGIEFAYDTGGMLTAALNFGLPSPINIKVQGSDLFTAEEIAQRVQRIAASVPGAVDVRIAQRMDYPQIGIDVDRVKAAQLGLMQEDVIKNVVTSVNSSIGFNPAFWIAPNGNHYFIGAQYAEDEIDSIETLRNIPLTGTNSEQAVPLRNVAQFYRTTGPSSISHLNITRTTDIYANVLSGYDVGSVAAEIEERLATSNLLQLEKKVTPRGIVYDVGGDYGGKGYNLSVSGEIETMRKSLKQFVGGFGMAVLLIYLVMVALLRSFFVPLAIILSVPLGMIGVALILVLTGTALSIPVAMGILMMTGIVVEFSIILLTFADQLVAQGQAVRSAIVDAVKIRFRPIMMTSLAAWLAMLPMAIGGTGAEANAPLARAIIGGIIAAALLSLTVVPCLYVIFKRDQVQPVTSTSTGE